MTRKIEMTLDFNIKHVVWYYVKVCHAQEIKSVSPVVSLYLNNFGLPHVLAVTEKLRFYSRKNHAKNY